MFLFYNFILKIIFENINVYYYFYNFYKYLIFLFLFIFIYNNFGLIPFGFAITSHLIVTYTLSIQSNTLINFFILERFGIYFFNMFLPQGSPIAVIFF